MFCSCIVAIIVESSLYKEYVVTCIIYMNSRLIIKSGIFMRKLM